MPSNEVKIKAIFVQKHPVKLPMDAIVVGGAYMDSFESDLDALAAKGTSLVIFENDIFKVMNEEAVEALIESLVEKGIASHIRIPVWYGDGKFIDPLTDPEGQVFRQNVVDQRKEDIEKYLAGLTQMIKTAQTDFAEGCRSIIEDLNQIEPADVHENLHGHWFFTEYDFFDCSICGNAYFNGCDSTAEAKERLKKKYDLK